MMDTETSNIPYASSLAANSLVGRSKPTGVHSNSNIYAIREGVGITNGIFLRYEDCRHLIEHEESIYSVFQDMHDALIYLTADSSTASPVGLSDDKRNSDQNTVNNPDEIMCTLPHAQTTNNCALSCQENRMPFTNNIGNQTSGRGSMFSSLSKKARKRTSAGINPNRRPTKAWEKMFDQFQKHVEGKVTPIVDSMDDPALHKWVKQQEIEYRNLLDGKGSSMFQAKINKLEGAGFKFSYVSLQDKYAMLLKFKEDNGHYDVPSSNQLYKWIEKQKTAAKKFSKGDSTNYFDMQFRDFTALGLCVGASNESKNIREEEHELKWDHYFTAISTYKRDNGDLDVIKEDNSDLFSWVQRQHQEYLKISEGKPSRLTLERVQKLTDIGFVFQQRKQSVRWDERIQQLKRFRQKHGHLQIPKRDPELGVFVNRQRYEYTKMMAGKQSSLTEERFNVLQDLGFVWQAGKKPKPTQKKSWEERYQELIEYKETYGHIMVPQQYPVLGEWIHSQRANFKKLKKGQTSSLTPDRLLKLANIGFVFDGTKAKGRGINATNSATRIDASVTSFDRVMQEHRLHLAPALPHPPAAMNELIPPVEVVAVADNANLGQPQYQAIHNATDPELRFDQTNHNTNERIAYPI